MITLISYLIISFITLNVLPNNSAIKKVQEKFNTLNNFQADFVQLSNNKVGLKGKFYFSKDDNYRIELKNNIIISDGTTIWNYDKKRNRVIISNIEDDPLSFSLKEYIFNYPPKCDISEKESASNNTIVVLKTKDTELNFKNAELWLTSDYLVSKIKVKDFNGSSFSFNFSNIEVDKNISDKLFKFSNNMDIKIIDLR